MAEDETPAAEAVLPGPFLREYTPIGFPAINARKASVVFYRNGGYSVVTVNGVRHVDKRALARSYTVCEIAQGTYVSPLQLELPAAGGTSFFKAEVDIEWEVTDPHLVAVQVVTDVAKRLTSPVLERLRELTLTYRVTDAEQANRAITRECVNGRWSDLGSDLGLRVRLYVRLGVDDEAIGYARKRREVHADAEVTRVRQEGFRRMLQGGELEQLSFMLAADPEGAKDFLEKIRQEGRQDERERVDRLYTMALRGELNSTDVETQVLNLLNRGSAGLTGPIGSVPARREPRQLEASADGPFTPDWVSDDPPGRRRPHRTEPSRDERDEPRRGRDEPRRGGPRRRDDGPETDDPPSRPGPRPHRPERYGGGDAARELPRGRVHRSDDGHADDDSDWGSSYGGSRRPERYGDGDDDRGPSGGRAYRPDDGYGDPAREQSRGRSRRPDPYRDGDPDREPDREPSYGRVYRPDDEYDGYGDGDFGWDQPRGRSRRPEPHPADDPDRDVPRAGSSWSGRRGEDDPDRDPPRGRRRSRDDGWDWAEEDL